MKVTLLAELLFWMHYIRVKMYPMNHIVFMFHILTNTSNINHLSILWHQHSAKHQAIKTLGDLLTKANSI